MGPGPQTEKMEMATSEQGTRVARRYDRIAWLYDFVTERRLFSKLRSQLLRGVEGDVLEVGVGTGNNFPYYPQGVRLAAIDISPKMLARAVEKAHQLGMEADLRVMNVEEMSFPDRSFDYVVSSLVFCSVENPLQGLREVARVMKENGELRMLEHVRSEQPLLGRIMDLLNPLARLIGDNINRRTLASLEAAGFEIISVQSKGPGVLKEIRASVYK